MTKNCFSTIWGNDLPINFMLKFPINYLEKPRPITSKWRGVTVRKWKVEHTVNEGEFLNLSKIQEEIKWERSVFLKKKSPPPEIFFLSKNVGNSIQREENMKWEKNNLKIKFQQHPINIKNNTAHPHDIVSACNAFSSYSAKTKRDGQDRQTDVQTDRQGAFQYFPSRREIQNRNRCCEKISSVNKMSYHLIAPLMQVTPFIQIKLLCPPKNIQSHPSST